VFETGGNFVSSTTAATTATCSSSAHRGEYLPDRAGLADHIKQQVDTGGVALYVWGVSADTLVRDGEIGRLARAGRDGQEARLARRRGRTFVADPHAVREDRGALRLLCEDVSQRRLPVGDPQASCVRISPARRRPRAGTTTCGASIRRKTARFHEVGHEAVDRLQDPRRRRDPAAAGIPVRLQERGPTSSPWACSTSRSRRTATCSNRPSSAARSASGPGGPEPMRVRKSCTLWCGPLVPTLCTAISENPVFRAGFSNSRVALVLVTSVSGTGHWWTSHQCHPGQPHNVGCGLAALRGNAVCDAPRRRPCPNTTLGGRTQSVPEGIPRKSVERVVGRRALLF